MKTLFAVVFLVASVGSVAGDVLPLGADAAVELALQASDRRDAASARVAAAGQQVEAADARRLPTLDLEASVAHRSAVPPEAFPADVPGVGGFVLFPNIQNTYRAGVVVTQPVWTGGAISGDREAARHEEAAATAEAARVDDDLRYEARIAYWSAVAADAALDAARSEAERAARLLDDARALRDAGMAVRADELGAAARLAAARVRVIDAEAEAANRRAALRSLLDLPPQTDLELTDRGERLPAEPHAIEPLIADALTTRPEVVALTARRDALASRSETVAAPNRPQVSLDARWDVARPNERYLPLSDEWNTSWSVGLFARWRVFDGHRTGSEVAVIRAEQAAVEADLAEFERRIALDVDTARRSLEAALAADSAAAAAVEAAAAREADSRDRYTAGIGTVSDVLDAQSELADAELALVRASSGAWIADAGLRRAVGR